MNASSENIWSEAPIRTETMKHTIMMIEEEAVTYVFGDPVTLSRTIPLFKECGYDASISLIESRDGFSIAAVILPTVLSDLIEVEWALGHLKGFPVNVWSWRMENSYLCEAVNVPSGVEGAPLLMVNMDGANELRVFGQREDINTYALLCESMDINTCELMYQGEVTGFTVNASQSTAVIDLVETNGTPVIYRGWSAYTED